MDETDMRRTAERRRLLPKSPTLTLRLSSTSTLSCAARIVTPHTIPPTRTSPIVTPTPQRVTAFLMLFGAHTNQCEIILPPFSKECKIHHDPLCTNQRSTPSLSTSLHHPIWRLAWQRCVCTYGFQVAVDDGHTVQVLHGVGDVPRPLEPLLPRQLFG
eukprot:m.1444769 g.1444769  ORF g.1444769 m.1444769 type:complete len:158 (+) comp25106_c0_seq18:777-1250(+)